MLVLLLGIVSAEQCDSGDSGDYPRVVIGCWQLLERERDQSQAVATLQAYVKVGFTAFDTADIYGPSEEILGKLRREIAGSSSGTPPRFFTKYVTGDSSLEEARRVNAKSRASLGAAPDMVQFHWWDYSDGHFVEAAQHLVTLQKEGKLKDVAACNFDVAHLKPLVDAGVPLVANQVQYSLLDRRPQNGMLAYAREHGLRLAAFGTVAGGWLTDTYLGAPRPSAAEAKTSSVSMRMYRSHLDRWSRGDWGLFQELLRTLRAVADKHTTTIANVAVAWVLHQLGDGGGWVILGVRDASHLEEHAALREVAIDAKDSAQIEAVLAKGEPPRGDIWSFERGLDS